MSNKKKAFTLVELVVVMAIVVIFGGMVMTLFLSQNRNFNYVQDSTIIQNDARLILTTLEDDIRIVKDGVREFPSESMIYRFKETTGDIYAYIYDKTNHTLKKCKMDNSNPDVIESEVLTLSKNVYYKMADAGNPEEKGIIIKNEPSGSNNYEIKLILQKNDEQLEFSSNVTTRN